MKAMVGQMPHHSSLFNQYHMKGCDNMNVIELNELIDLTNRFFDHGAYPTLTIGGIVGSHPLSHILDVATDMVPFESILIIEGCEDFCYIPKKPIPNYIPYQQLFIDMFVENVKPYDPFAPRLWEENQPKIKAVDQEFIRRFQLVIINNAHLIEPEMLRMIVDVCKWKSVLIGDPFDVGGEPFMDAPTIVNCLEKQSPIIGMARKLWGVPTYAIDKKAPGTVNSGRVTRKGIGKLDGRTYISNHLDLVQAVQNQQRKQAFRKGQKFFVTDDRIYNIMEEKNHQLQHITKNALLIMGRTNSLSQIPQQFQIHHSKYTIRCDVIYDHIGTYPNEWDYRIKVKPANILSVADAKYHRYFNTVFVCIGDVSKRELYSVMKNSVNLTLCGVKGVSE